MILCVCEPANFVGSREHCRIRQPLSELVTASDRDDHVNKMQKECLDFAWCAVIWANPIRAWDDEHQLLTLTRAHEPKKQRPMRIIHGLVTCAHWAQHGDNAHIGVVRHRCNIQACVPGNKRTPASDGNMTVQRQPDIHAHRPQQWGRSSRLGDYATPHCVSGCSPQGSEGVASV